MSTPVTYVGTQYNVPAYQDIGWAQGSGNLSSYLIALATGSLTLSGGSFPLTADADFGGNFGLKSIYYKSRSATPATTGVIRLGSAEMICWRDNGNTADLELTTNASDQLTYNGLVIATSTGALVGTTLTLSATSNQMVIGTTNTTTVSFTAPSASRVYTVPDAGGNVEFVMAGGAQSIAGIKTFTSQLNASGNVTVGTGITLRTINAVIPTFQIEGTDGPTGSMSVIRNSNNATGSAIYFGKSRGTTVGAVTIVQNGDEVGRMIFNAADGSDLVSAVARISAFVDGTPGAGVTPGQLSFYTTAAASGAPTERVRINSSGQILFSDGTAALPSASFISDPDIGVYRAGTNAVGIATAGVLALRINAATASAATDQDMIINSGPLGTTTTFRSRSTANITTGATTVATCDQFCCLVLSSGFDGTNVFGDLVFTASGVATPTVVAAKNSGSPAARTYSTSTSSLQLAMGSGTYDITTLAINQRVGSF